MIGYVNGSLAEKQEDSVIIDVNGMGIVVYITQEHMCCLPPVGSTIKVYTYTYVKEDAFLLYGFQSKDELDLFKLLISVNGIGPKSGLGILSVLSADDLRFAIYAGDAKTIAKAPGIGKKTAERLVLELKGKVSIETNDADSLQSELSSLAAESPQQNRKDAMDALVALGYGSMEAAKAVKSVNASEETDVEEIIKKALKYLL